ncbi:hypothetical protein ACFVY1_44515 [Streptomyces sp. NPDC058293]|uniref:hypothetical protein n=1 Tax=Streptomyces sp. NPDC058293 TaxID=3346429 RepID=UPI0036E0302D
MSVASIGKARKAAESVAGDDLPIDLEAIASQTDVALAMELSTSTREDIDRITLSMVGHLNLMLCEELGAREDEGVRKLVRQGYDLISHEKRPTVETPSFVAFHYLRDAGALTRRLMRIYAERNDLDVP